jgi:hypothetical protein
MLNRTGGVQGVSSLQDYQPKKKNSVYGGTQLIDSSNLMPLAGSVQAKR